jgi:hypothetical protein
VSETDCRRDVKEKEEEEFWWWKGVRAVPKITCNSS